MIETLPPLDIATQAVAPIQEVFSSVQGEGPYVGCRQVFVRVAHCHLKCAYCDTPMQSDDGRAHLETIPGTPEPETVLDNPVSAQALAAGINHLLAQLPHHSVSLTGGEPLLYHRFLAELIPLLPVPVYLETSGTQPDFLKAVLDATAPHPMIIAMDIKLPSATGEAGQWQAHTDFLREALDHARVQSFVKCVYNEALTDEELARIGEVLTMAGAPADLPVIFQPETPLQAPLPVPFDAAQARRIHQALAAIAPGLRFIPQTHKMLAVR